MNSLDLMPLAISDEILFSPSRIQYSEGTRIVDKSDGLAARYVEDAIVPAGAFHRSPVPTAGSLKFSANEFSRDGKNFVAVIGLKNATLPLFELGIHSAQNYEDIREVKRGSQYAVAIQHVFEELLGYCTCKEKIQMLGIALKGPGLTTVTKDPQTGKLIGLHVDSWDRGKVNSRSDARNRICINLGKEDRFFLFVNKKVSELTGHRVSGATRFDQGSCLVKRFLKENPNYPVTRVRVAPGEAYIAPTDNLIHDATTEGKVEVDISLSFLGNFSIEDDALFNVLPAQ